MPILITAEVPNQTQEGYDGMIAVLGDIIKAAPGFIMHTAFPVEGGWRNFEIWETERDANQFFAKFVHPNLPQGVKPKRTVHQLHSLVTL
jgi:hypothetical protein